MALDREIFSPEELQEIFRQNPTLSPTDLQAKFNVSEAILMLAMANEAGEVPLVELDSLLETIRQWGEVLSLIRNQNAVSELLFQAQTLYRRGDWLNSIDPAYNLHIRIAATRRILLLIRANHRREGKTFSVNFVDASGSVFWRLYARSETDREKFGQLLEMYRGRTLSLPPAGTEVAP